MMQIQKPNSNTNEFSLIDKYFKQQPISRSDVVLGIGDDAALVRVPTNRLLVLAIDTLVEGVHFPQQTKAGDVGYKALAVNLSDLAAMGAEPAWITLALCLPEANSEWLGQMSSGIYELAKQHQVQLIGGDTVRGPLSLTIQAHGFVPPDQALCRRGAKPGDKIYVSGTLGDAGLGLKVLQEEYSLPNPEKEFVLQRLNRPSPRIQLGLLLRNLASSAIDISDGLLADLGHILESSQVGAEIEVEALPLSAVLKKISLIEAQHLALSAGDDYELCFTVSSDKESELLEKLNASEVRCTCIGKIRKESGLKVVGWEGRLVALGYRHFS